MLLGTSRQVSTGLLVLRITFGCFMLVHGIQKAAGFGGMSEGFPDPLGVGNQLSLILAILAEVGGSILLIIGLGTRIAAAQLAFTMIVALFLVHGADPWKVKELAAVYLAVYTAILVAGPGHFSLDQKLFGRRQPPID